MNLIKFFRGPKASYSAASTHKDALYFATDSNELIMNGNSYGDKIKDNGLTFTEVQSGANKGHVVATIELNSGKTFANVDLGVYGRSEVDSKIASVSSDTTTLAGRVTTAEGNITSLDTRLTSAEGSITTLTAGSSTEGSVAYQIAQIVANAPASFDTLKEIADWIANDTTGAAKMAADIETLKTGKVDKVTGKQLSTEDYTTAEKTKLAGIEAGALVNPTNVSAFTNDAKYVTEDDMQVDVVDANGHDYVEIGGLKWATMNIGASQPSDYGLHFQWGDTQGYTADQLGSGEGQKYFGMADYKYGDGTSSGAAGKTKYNSTDDLTTLEASDDAAVANWGGSWRMPTTEEYAALGAAVNFAWTADYQGSGVAGLVCTDKTDSSKVLFFPATGYYINGSVHDVGSRGYYWSSSVYSSDTRYACYLLCSSSGFVNWQNYDNRVFGSAVRPILDTSKGPKYATKAELTSTESTLNTADTTINTRITNLTGQEGSTYTARSTEDASFIKNATNIQDALNKLDDASIALTTLLTWQEIIYVPTPNLFYRVCPVNDIATPVVVDENGEVCYVDHGGNFSVLLYNVATGIITEDSTDAVLTACEAFTGGSFELEFSTDASGNTVYTNGDYHIAVNNSGIIVEGKVSVFNSPDVIAVDGAVQVFANENCTEYATGSEQAMYVRLNRAFGENANKTWGDGSVRNSLSIITPTTQVPSDPYAIGLYIDWGSNEFDQPFVAGQVVRCDTRDGEISNPVIIFRDE